MYFAKQAMFFVFLVEYVSKIVDCDDVVYLTAIYGIIVGGAVIGFSVCLGTLLVMVNSVSWKNPWKVGVFTAYVFPNCCSIDVCGVILSLYPHQASGKYA